MNPIVIVIAAWAARKLGVRSLDMFHGPISSEGSFTSVDGAVLEYVDCEYEEEEEGRRVGF